ncbi:hypothetical protein Rifp1Sym_dg00110 [endosymbiont of Riftia pachyptila (vent Ph05)]|uniref:Uncharacterized protein n=1 Tax=endosymbiont of Riftia pachyptila (vent Ph05) TaxID=1048808 RepID=G2DG75_9GAMM|nr:hypothetical protein Rifp1Sym_dg00110 [endosymbiont of Riftia pachyptila (vent Ph05)]
MRVFPQGSAKIGTASPAERPPHAGIFPSSILFQVRRCRGVADVGSIDRSETGNPARWKQRGPPVRPGCLVSPDPYRGGGSHLHGRGLSAQRDPPFPDSGRPVTIEAEGLAAFPQPPPGRLREGRRPSPVTGPKPQSGRGGMPLPAGRGSGRFLFGRLLPELAQGPELVAQALEPFLLPAETGSVHGGVELDLRAQRPQFTEQANVRILVIPLGGLVAARSGLRHGGRWRLLDGIGFHCGGHVLGREFVDPGQCHGLQRGPDLDDQAPAGQVVGGIDTADAEVPLVLAFLVLVEECVLDGKLAEIGHEPADIERAVTAVDGADGQYAAEFEHGASPCVLKKDGETRPPGGEKVSPSGWLKGTGAGLVQTWIRRPVPGRRRAG